MLQSIKKIYGYKLGASDGEIGHVKDFYFDDQRWTVRYVVADTGAWLPGRLVLIAPHAFGGFHQAGKLLPVKLTRKQIEDSPSIMAHEPVARQYEEKYFRYYGWPYYWQGGGLWGTSAFPILEVPVSSQPRERPTVSGPQPERADAHLRSAHAVNGYHVKAGNEKIGRICDFMMDEQSWAIRGLVIKTGHWLSGRKVQIPTTEVERVSYEESTVFVKLTRDAVKNIPQLAPAKLVSPGHEKKRPGHLQKLKGTELVIFNFHAPAGAEVYVAGTFNHWDPTAIKFGDNGKGKYTATVQIPLGRYEYKFIVNGEWRNDPEGREQVPNAFGTTNSVLVVSRTSTHRGHLHTFPQSPVNFDRPLWSTTAAG